MTAEQLFTCNHGAMRPRPCEQGCHFWLDGYDSRRYRNDPSRHWLELQPAQRARCFASALWQKTYREMVAAKHAEDWQEFLRKRQDRLRRFRRTLARNRKRALYNHA